MVQPVRMEQYLEAMAAQNHYSRQESLALLQNGHFFRDMNHKLELAQYFLIFEIRQELADLFHNILTPEETAGKILDKWQKFTAGRLLL